ncbi:MAG: EamA family transporter, partial [Burkholderiaceae bacterium]
MSEQAAAKRSARVVNRTDVALIALVTISWGLSYPVMKFVVNAYPPATFRALSFAVGVVSLWLYMRWRGESLAVPTALWPRLGKLSLMNMMLWHAGLIYGLTLLASGRAATIGYTMPVWA